MAQAIMRELGLKVAVDGIWGKDTEKAYSSLSDDFSQLVSTGMGLVTPGASPLGLYRKPAVVPAMSAGAQQFGQIVQAVTVEARRRSLDPFFYVAQIALESGWGKHVPLTASGENSWNYAGLKYESVKARATQRTVVDTSEYSDGQMVRVKDGFAVFGSPEEFADTFFWYLFDSGSSYRYKGLENAVDAMEFGTILQRGGYATSPTYALQIAQVVRSVASRYGDMINNIA